MENWRRRLRAYAFATACVASSFLFAALARPYGSLEDLAMIHLLGVVVLALWSTVNVSFATSILSIALFDFFFIEPEFEFAWTDVKSSLTFLAMMIVAVTVSSLSEGLRRQEQSARAIAFRAQALYELNVDLASSRDVRQLAAISARHIEKLFAGRANILLQKPDGGLEAASGPSSAATARSAWVRREFVAEKAQSGTTIWVPVLGIRSTLGVIGLEVRDAFERGSEQGYMLMACASQFGSAVEGAQIAGAMQRAQVEAQAERMRSSLLSAVSHDLRTPLTAMLTAGTTLASKLSELPSSDAQALISSIVGEGQRLNRLIHNLLMVSRLEAPTVELRRTPEAMEDIVRSALEGLSNRPALPRITADLPVRPLPLVFAEPVMIEQVLVNLIENGLQHGRTEVRIKVAHAPGSQTVTVQVVDRGPGIAEHEREKVFEKFYRGRRAGKGDGGVGLGLTICRAIVLAHGGRIAVRERSGGGAEVEFNLPVTAAAEVIPEPAS